MTLLSLPGRFAIVLSVGEGTRKAEMPAKLGFTQTPATRRKQATMNPISLERILESAIVASWPDLTRGP